MQITLVLRKYNKTLTMQNTTSIVRTNRNNIEKILKVLSNKPTNRNNKESNIIIKAYYEWLLTPESGIDRLSIAVCIRDFFNYPATKPGKIYVWPDNLVNLHRFITGKTRKFVYQYPDIEEPERIQWNMEVSFNRYDNSINYSETWKYSGSQNTWYNTKELTQLLKFGRI